MRRLILLVLAVVMLSMTACSSGNGDPDKPAFDDAFYQRMDQAAATLLPELLTTQQVYYKDSGLGADDIKALENYAKDLTRVMQKGRYSEYLKLMPFEKDSVTTKQLFYVLQAMAQRYKFQLGNIGYQSEGDNEALLTFNWTVKNGPVKNGMLSQAYVMLKGDDGTWAADRPLDGTALCVYNFDLMLLKVPDFLPQQEDNTVFSRQDKADIIQAINDVLNALVVGDMDQLENMLYNKEIIPDEYKQMLQQGAAISNIRLGGQLIINKIADDQAAVSIKAKSDIPNLNGRAQLILRKTENGWKLENIH